MRCLILSIAFVTGMLPGVAKAQLLEMRQTIFGMD